MRLMQIQIANAGHVVGTERLLSHVWGQRGSGDRQRDRVFSAEGDRALRQYDARRRPLAGGAGITGPADCAGSNFGTGCAGAHLDPSLAPDSRTNIRSPRDGDRFTSTPLTPGTAVPRE